MQDDVLSLIFKATHFYYKLDGLYYVMVQAVPPSVRPLANSCDHNSYSFQWMILKPSRIVIYGT